MSNAPDPFDRTFAGFDPFSHRPSIPRRNAPPLCRNLAATHNPFYAISAALVFYGLRVSFRAGATAHYSVYLMVCLAAYALLLASTALLLRKLGTLWEDIRMLVLLVVLLLPGMSVTFDDALVASPELGRLLYLVGGVFAAIVCELLLLGLRVRFPAGYRLPFHGLMALFFVYPPLVARLASNPGDATLQWTMFSFAPAVAVILLMLVPAVTRGARYVEGNGTPWQWPLYPLTVFAVLTLCAGGRAYYLCRSFHFVGDYESIFGAYFLIPLVFAVAVLALLGGRRARRSTALSAALTLPALWLGLATIEPHRDKIYTEFLGHFQTQFHTLPATAALVLAVVFYGIAFLLQVPRSFHCLVATTLLLTVVGPKSRAIWHWREPQAWPLVVSGMMLLIWGAYHRRAVSCLGAAGCAVLTVLVSARDYPQMPAYFTAFHVGLASLLVLGAAFRDERGKRLQMLAVGIMLLSCLHSLQPQRRALFTEVPDVVATWYAPTAALTAAAYGAAVAEPWMMVAAGCMLLEWAGLYGWRGYRWLRLYVLGLDQIAWGMAAFAAAVALSVAKGKRRLRFRPRPRNYL